MMFQTDRLEARHFVEEDLEDFAALCGDPAVMRFVGDGTTLHRSEVAGWIQVCKEKYEKRGYGASAVFCSSSPQRSIPATRNRNG